jgi:hypothetical protein
MSKALKCMIEEYLGPNKQKIILEGIKLFSLDIKREKLLLQDDHVNLNIINK